MAVHSDGEFDNAGVNVVDSQPKTIRHKLCTSCIFPHGACENASDNSFGSNMKACNSSMGIGQC